MADNNDPDNSFMFILVVILLLRSCGSCESRDVEKRLDKIEAKIDSIKVR